MLSGEKTRTRELFSGSMSATAGGFRARLERLIERGRECRGGNSDPPSEWFDVGEEEADVLLGLSPGNRHESSADIDKYARIINSEGWHKVADFVIDWTGKFRDGHHRCRAIKKTGRTVRVRITSGVDPDAVIEGIDAGRKRSIAQQIAMRRGLKNATRVVACVGAFMRLVRENRTGQHARGVIAYSVEEVDSAIQFCEDALDSVRPIVNWRCPASFVGAVMLAHFCDPDLARSFAEDVARGTNLPDGDPAFTMREYLRDTDSAGSSNAFSISTRTLYALKARKENRKLKKFSVKDETGIVNWWLQQKRAVARSVP